MNILQVINSTTTSPPGSPNRGDSYIIGPAATGDWSGKDYQITTSIDGVWHYSGTPADATMAWDIAQAALLMYQDGTGWKVIGTQAFNVPALALTVSNPPTQAEVQAIADAVDGIISSMTNSSVKLMATP